MHVRIHIIYLYRNVIVLGITPIRHFNPSDSVIVVGIGDFQLFQIHIDSMAKNVVLQLRAIHA